MELSGEQLEEPKRHEEYERPRQIGIFMQIGIHPQRVQDRRGLAPDLARVDAELFEERKLVVEAAAADSAAGEDGGGEGGGGGRRIDVEGHEGEVGVRGTERLKWRRREAARLGAASGGNPGGKDDRRDCEFLRHGRAGKARVSENCRQLDLCSIEYF
eukprot:TRINITY_DN951_c0_g1_i2.p2 TRINITY_DN951_c0_g1~~TRINITY_DN951_c0_g1_i2.p2  ORF type:complete len:158 (+),score=25.97 TRINITY_DN951_c0_g1_i2:1194-1667(+)